MGFLAIPLFAIGGATVTVGTVLAIGMAVISSVSARNQRKRAERAARDAWNASLRDRLVTRRSAIGERDIVLGKVRKAGSLTFVASSGSNKEYMWQVLTMAGHPVEAIDTVYFNEFPLTINPDGSVASPPYTKYEQTPWTSVDFIDSNTVTVGGVYTIPVPGYVSGSARVFCSPKRIKVNDIKSESNKAPYSEFGKQLAQVMRLAPADAETRNGLQWVVTGEVCTITVVGAQKPNSFIQVNYTKSIHVPRAWVHKYKGNLGEDFSPALRDNFPGEWTAAHQQQGCAKLLVLLQYDPDVFNQGAPEVTCVVRGANNIYDPRTSTYGYTENNALHIRHLCLLPTYGKQQPSSINEASFIACANACDAAVTYSVGGVESVRPRYRSGIVVRHNTIPHEACLEITEGMAGRFIYAQGVVTVKAGVYTAPVMDITDADLAPGPISISASIPREQLVNYVTGTFQDETQDYKTIDFPKVLAEEYITQDGQALPTDVEYGSVNYVGQAQYISGIRLRDNRHALTVEATWKMKLYPLEVFDVVRWKSDVLGVDYQEFELVKRSWSLTGLLRLTFKATSATVYSMAGDYDPADAVVRTNLPRFWEFEGTGPLTCESGDQYLLPQADGTFQSRIYVTWPTITDKSVTTNGRIQIAYAPYPSFVQTPWPYVEVDGDSEFALLPNVQDGAYYVIKARVFNGVAWSTWLNSTEHLVVGKTAKPANVDEFTLSVQPDGTRQFNAKWTVTPKPIDLLGYRIRYRQGVGPYEWEEMKEFETEQGFIPLFPFETNQFLAGDYVFACKTVDKSQNEAETPLFIIGALPNPRLGNAVLAVDYGFEDWPGTFTNCVVDTFEGQTIVRAADKAVWTGGASNIPTTWDAWTRWVWDPYASWTYTSPTYDFNVPVAVLPVANTDAVGDVDFEEQHSDDNISWSSWSFVAGPVRARFIRTRVTVTVPVGSPSGPGLTPVTYIRQHAVIFTGKVEKESGNDISPAALTGVHRIGVGQIRLPTQIEWALYSRINVVMQNVGGKWTWDIAPSGKDLVNGPHVRFYSDGVLADPPLIDFDIEGIPAI